MNRYRKPLAEKYNSSRRKRSSVRNKSITTKCDICRGRHDNIECPRTTLLRTTTYNDIPVCANCNQGRHDVIFCAYRPRLTSKCGKNVLMPFVLGDEESYERVAMPQSSLSSDNKQFERSDNNSIKTVNIQETRLSYDSNGNKIDEVNFYWKHTMPNHSTSVIFIENDHLTFKKCMNS